MASFRLKLKVNRLVLSQAVISKPKNIHFILYFYDIDFLQLFGRLSFRLYATICRIKHVLINTLLVMCEQIVKRREK